ncbi:MAG: hypothetical protein Q7S79_01110, partial [bacterium]|nr:hypothetical protein [bacterium]
MAQVESKGGENNQPELDGRKLVERLAEEGAVVEFLLRVLTTLDTGSREKVANAIFVATELGGDREL